jgi:hypothetical protein
MRTQRRDSTFRKKIGFHAGRTLRLAFRTSATVGEGQDLLWKRVETRDARSESAWIGFTSLVTPPLQKDVELILVSRPPPPTQDSGQNEVSRYIYCREKLTTRPSSLSEAVACPKDWVTTIRSTTNTFGRWPDDFLITPVILLCYFCSCSRRCGTDLFLVPSLRYICTVSKRMRRGRGERRYRTWIEKRLKHVSKQ